MVNELFFGGKLNLPLKKRSSGLCLACLSQHVSIAVLKLGRQRGTEGVLAPVCPVLPNRGYLRANLPSQGTKEANIH